jgi:hypothetical protein
MQFMNKDSEPEEGLMRSVLRSGMMWFFIVFCLGFMTREIYLRYTGNTFALEPLYWYLFVEHQAISMPTIVVVMIAALLVDSIRAKRNPEPKLRLFWKVVGLLPSHFRGTLPYMASNLPLDLSRRPIRFAATW